MEQPKEAKDGNSVNTFTDRDSLAALHTQVRLLRDAQLRLVEVNKTLNTQVEQQMVAKREALRRAEQAEKRVQELTRENELLHTHASMMKKKLQELGVA